jgi:hypothetical protein
MFSFILTQTDTTVIDTTLQPDITYVYQTTAQINGTEQKSDTLQVKTLNTTSHNFNWQTFTFGNPAMGSSTLYDVAIINENDIWAVGEIYDDTTGQAYNAVHWNGTSWELKRISVLYNGNLITPPLYGIFAFSSTDIWLSSGVPVHGNGTDWTQYHLFDMGILNQNDGYLTKIWGNSTSDVYFVGTLGTIAHYKNGSWSKIESGTNALMQDIWGYTDQDSHLSKVMAVAFSSPGEARILSLASNIAVDTLNWPTNSGLGSIWFNNFHLFVSGSGVWTYRNNVWEKMNGVPDYFLNTIRGDKINNLFAVGWTTRMVHFNGIEWQEITNIPPDVGFESVVVKNHKVVAVGFSSSGGVVGLAVICMSSQ